MVLPPRHPLESMAIREILAKRQSSTCSNECLAPGNIITSSSDPYAFCSQAYVDAYQICFNCLAALPYFNADASYFNQLKSSFDQLADTCKTLGKPAPNPLTIPPLNTYTGTVTGTPSGIYLPTGADTVKSSSTSQAATGSGTSEGPPIGAIVGGVIGGVAVIAGIILAIFFLRRRNGAQPLSAGAGLIQDAHTDYHNDVRVTPFQYPASQGTGTPPPQMQQFNPYSTSQLDAASSVNATSSVHHSSPQQQFALPPGASMKQRLGPSRFASPMPDSNTSNYAPSTFSGSSDAPYPAVLSPPPPSTNGSSRDSNAVHNPSISTHSSAPLISPQLRSPAAGHQVDSPPAYDDGSAQPDVSSQASSSGPAPLSAAEMELISQRVATLINAGGGLPPDARKKD